LFNKNNIDIYPNILIVLDYKEEEIAIKDFTNKYGEININNINIDFNVMNPVDNKQQKYENTNNEDK